MTVHMDVDTGVDDALAILMALFHPQLCVVGFSTVAGNTSARQAARNTRFLLGRVGMDRPVYVGREESIDGRPVEPVPSVHGEDGLGGITGGYDSGEARGEGDPQPESAEAIVRAARAYGPQLTLLATGPATNVARALQIDPAAMARVGRVIWMGGSFDEGGNVTPHAEFNARADPNAAEMVLRSGLPLTVVPLDVTHRVRLMRRDLADGALTPPLDPGLHVLLRDMTHVYMCFHQRVNAYDGCYMHDALTVAALVRPELFTCRRSAVDVVTSGGQIGRTVWRADGAPEVDVAVGVDAAGCLDLFWSVMSTGKASWGGAR